MMRRKLLLICVVCMLIALSGCGKSSEESSVPETSPVTETTSVTEADTESETETESAAEETIPDTNSASFSQQEIVQAMQEAIQEQGYTAEFHYDDTEQAYVFIFWEDQFGETIDLIEGNSSGWDTVRTEFLNIYARFSDMLLKFDDQTPLILKIVDERDHNHNLIVVQDNEITYDIMQEKITVDQQDTLTVEDFAFSKPAIADKLNETFNENGTKAQAVYDESEKAYIISIWYDGLGERTEKMEANSPDWENNKSLFLTTCDSIQNILAQLDSDTPCILQVVDDRNHDVNLMVIQNNEITYDILAQ